VEDCVKYDDEERKLILSSSGCKVELSIALQALEVSSKIDSIIYWMISDCRQTQYY
jgi:hypothetical protein